VPRIKVTANSFADFACAQGPERPRIVQQIRHQYEDPDCRAFDYYKPVADALREGLRARDAEQRLGDLPKQAKLKGQDRHFAELAQGAALLLTRIPAPEVILSPTGSVNFGDLVVSVNPQIAVEFTDGRREAWLLYCKEKALNQDMADAPLLVLERMLASKLSGLAARVIDVRRGKRFRLTANRNRQRLNNFLDTEAETFVKYWHQAVVAA